MPSDLVREMLDEAQVSCTLQLTGRVSEIDEFVGRLRRSGDSAVARSGTVAVSKGEVTLTSFDALSTCSSASPWPGLVADPIMTAVVKVGSSLLVDEAELIAAGWTASRTTSRTCRCTGHELLVVSSGAIAIGSSVLGINKRRARLEDLQAAAAAGQVQLVHAYQEALAVHGIGAAQILLTPRTPRIVAAF